MKRALPESTPTRRHCTKEGCSGRIEPSVDRHGQSCDECSDCGTIYRRGVAVIGAPIAPSSNGSSGSIGGVGTRPCPVEGCPGKVVAGGSCDCCAKRQRFADEHLPKPKCGICGGSLERVRKYCDACKPIMQKVNVAKHYTNHKR